MGPPPYRQFSMKMINKARLKKLDSYGSEEQRPTECTEEEKVKPGQGAIRYNTVGLDYYLPIELTSNKA